MNLSLSPNMMDIIILVVFLILLVIGYLRGFVTRFYDIVSTIFVIIFSYVLCGPISHVFKIYQYGDDFASLSIGPIVNQIIVFILLFVFLFIVKVFVGIIVKPLIKKLFSHIKLLESCDHILGVLLSLLEGIMISYLALVLIITPIFSNGSEIVQDTILANAILNIIPGVSEDINTLTYDYHQLANTEGISDENVLNTMLDMSLKCYQMGLINDEQIISLLESDLGDSLQKNSVKVSLEDKVALMELLENSALKKNEINNILDNMKVNIENEK